MDHLRKLLERKKSSANLGADADETQAYDASPIAKSILNSSEPIDLLESDEEGDGDETVRKCLAGQLSAAASEQGRALESGCMLKGEIYTAYCAIS